jgi:6-phosphogluconolactonase
MKGPKKDRVTLSFPVLNNAHNIIFLVSGNSKAGIVRAVLEGKDRRRLYPAVMINPVHGNITWLIDKAAAHRLKTIE